MAAFFKLIFIYMALVTFSGTDGRPTSPSLHGSFKRYVTLLKKINDSPNLRAEWSKHVQTIREEPALHDFQENGKKFALSCENAGRSPSRPTSVHRLRAGDIDVVAAMGDSLTAGNGALASTIFGCLTEYRGRSWSIGGDLSYEQGVTTLPNILRNFNPAIKGFSVGRGDENSAGAKMNVAVAGAIAQDMPAQARDLVNRLNNSDIDFKNDWKMVTLFIGGNNLCDYCNDLNAHSAETMIANVKEAVDYLSAKLPRTFVNLVEIFDIAPVANLGNGFICGLVHNAVCGCGHGADANTEELTALSVAYQKAVEDLVASGRYDGKDDFTVVSQTFFKETTPPPKANGDPDLSYFAPDCFHFSSKGQNIAGKGLWLSLIEPVGQKPKDWGLDRAVECPKTEFLPTRKNY